MRMIEARKQALDYALASATCSLTWNGGSKPPVEERLAHILAEAEQFYAFLIKD